jgi:4-amino-4-deoxy-L-arabinose transferase-like glycosyltransferase
MRQLREGGEARTDTVLPLHDAARLATGWFVGIALLFLGLTGRELYGRGYGAAAVLAMIGCVGTVARLHQLITDVALFAGMAIGTYGLALARRSALGAGVALGIGGACAFLSKGLLGPGWLALTALLLPYFRAWRTRRYVVALGIAALIAIIPATIWMGALYTRSPTLFFD